VVIGLDELVLPVLVHVFIRIFQAPFQLVVFVRPLVARTIKGLRLNRRRRSKLRCLHWDPFKNFNPLDSKDRGDAFFNTLGAEFSHRLSEVSEFGL
jgi:hypothetical protein